MESLQLIAITTANQMYVNLTSLFNTDIYVIILAARKRDQNKHKLN